MNAENKRDKLEKWEEGKSVIQKVLPISMSVSLFPVPLLDLAIATAIQIRMVSVLAEIYEVPFVEEKAKPIIYSLMGSVANHPFSMGLVFGISRLIPGMSYTIGPAAFSSMSGEVTYAVGMVFLKHFSNGGSIDSLNLSIAREYFAKARKEYQKEHPRSKPSKKGEKQP